MRVRLALASAILLLAVPVTAQGPDVELVAEPATGTSPLDVTLHARTSQPVNVTWWIFISHADGTVETIAAGEALPANVSVQLPAGTFEFRLAANFTHGVRIASEQVQVAEPVTSGKLSSPWVTSDVMPLAFAGALMLGLAGWLYARDPRNRLNIAFALLFTARGLADVTNGLLANGANGGKLVLHAQIMDRLHPAVTIGVVAAAAYFLVVYLGQNNPRLAVARPGPITASAAAALILLAVWRPTLYWGAPDAPGGILLAFTGLYYPLYSIIVYLLVRESRKDIPDDRRAGAFYSAVGFLFIPAFVGAGELLFVDVLGFFRALHTDTGIGFAIGHWAAVLSLVPLGMAAAIMVRAARREPQRHHTRLHAAVFLGALLVALGSVVLPLLAYQAGGLLASRSLAVARLFWIFQGIWAIPYAVLVAWGLTRYQASDKQSGMRRQLRRFGLATIFFTIFFAVSEGLEGLASSRLGDEIGLATAAGLTLVLGPVQERLQRRFVDALPPEAETSQEIRFYEAQLRRTLMDGFIGEQERKFLANLQLTMGISNDTAQRIEARLVAEAASS